MPAQKAHDTSRLKRGFLEEYRQCGNITLAAEVAGIDRRTHYRWSEADPDYCEAFESATEEATDRLEAEARRRAVEGVQKPVGWYKGEPGGYVREYSDTLLIFLLKGAAPDKYRDRLEMRGFMSNLDLTTMSNEVIDRIAHGENPMAVIASAAERGVLLLEQESKVLEAEIIEEGEDLDR